MIVAHALFKSTLFLVVGVVDHATGTRDLRRLSGLGRRLPVLAGVGGLAAASMAGVPPLLGFVAKEAAFAALLDGGLPDRTRCRRSCWPGSSLGSALTAAYTARFCVGRVRPQARARRHRPGRTGRTRPARCSSPPRPCSRWPGWCSGLASPLLEPLVAGLRRARCRWSPTRPRSSALWHGLQPALAAVGGHPARRRRAVRRPRPAGPVAAAARRRRLGRRGLLEHDAGARPARRPGHRHHPARARCRPTSARSSSSCWRCPARC